MAVLGLTPALNAQTYGAASNSGEPITFSELFSVAAGAQPVAYPFNGATQGAAGQLVASPDDHLYTFFGTEGGTPVFNRLDYKGEAAPLYTLSASQGRPYVMFLGADGKFYGLSLMNNTTNAGVFRLTAKGSFSWVLPTFSTGTYGVSYCIALIQAGNGKFYGTLPQGGSANAGSIYEATLDGKMRTIYEFPQLRSGIPETLLQASDGMLYGTARGLYQVSQTSSVFRLNPNTGAFTTIYGPLGPTQGSCECQLIQGSDGKLYGVAENGATYGLGRSSCSTRACRRPSRSQSDSQHWRPSAMARRTALGALKARVRAPRLPPEGP